MHSQSLNKAPLESWVITRSSREIMLPSKITSVLQVFQISTLQIVNYGTILLNSNIVDCIFKRG